MLASVCLLGPSAAAQAEGTDKIREHYRDETLPVGEYRDFRLSDLDKLDTIHISVRANASHTFDLYILEEDQYELYAQNQNFDAKLAQEDKRGWYSCSWEQPDYKRYLLVVDNRDNPRSSDAVANTTLVYDLRLEYPWPRTIEDIFNGHIGWEFIIGLAAGMLYVAGIIYVHLELERQLRDPLPWVALAVVCSPLAVVAWRFFGLHQKPPPTRQDRIT